MLGRRLKGIETYHSMLFPGYDMLPISAAQLETGRRMIRKVCVQSAFVATAT